MSVLPLSALLLIGCSAGRGEPAQPAFEPPHLVPVGTGDVDGGPDVGSVVVIAGRGGRVAYNPDSDDFGPIAVLRPGQAIPDAIGRRGEGPGELSFPLPLGFGDSTLFIYDLRKALVSEWDAAGRELRTYPRIGAIRPLDYVPGRGVIGVRDRAAGIDIYLVDPTTGTERLIVPVDDPTAQRLFAGAADLPLTQQPRRVVAGWAGGIVLGNGTTYRLALYDWDGRPVATPSRSLPPNLRNPAELDQLMIVFRSVGMVRGATDSVQVRARVATQPKDWFAPTHPPRVDAKGRLWVVVDTGDEAVADVFKGDRFLGRVPIPCRTFEGRWGLAGDMLVLQCASEDPASDRSVVLRWFRIVDPGSAGDR